MQHFELLPSGTDWLRGPDWLHGIIKHEGFRIVAQQDGSGV